MRAPLRRGRMALVAAAVVVVLVAGAGAASALRPSDEAADHRAEATRVLLHASGTGEVPTPSAALRERVSTAGGLRVGLRVLLGRHVSTTARTLEGAVVGSADLEAQAEVLRANSRDLAAAISLVYGDAGARAFDELWSQHAQFLVAYGAAVGEGDDGAAEAARADLDDYHQAFSSFCNLATGLPEPAVEELIGGHLDDLLGYVDAVAAGDRGRSTDLLGDALSEVLTIADALAGAIVAGHPDLFPGTVDDPASERTARVVGAVEGLAALVVEAERAGRPGPPGVDVPELDPAVVDAVAALAGPEDRSATTDGLARAAAAAGSDADAVRDLVAAADTWRDAVTDHADAVAAGRDAAVVAAADRVELDAVALAVALAATPAP